MGEEIRDGVREGMSAVCTFMTGVSDAWKTIMYFTVSFTPS